MTYTYHLCLAPGAHDLALASLGEDGWEEGASIQILQETPEAQRVNM